ncbi:erythromycin esterase family protein [Noviherbaspirillum sp. CPCC 100848]|uniref:Erythromycin esterase family protein n=1 Tax=Noviherbaspirillum album TaxID=3080276 RepID=A0ABU6JBG4_9BURK|nr:erythromycin esterase family protein [Noviherbaspirillum sp. CPCC 100848]MEC4720976.1 erythromycin esterase family protein [Noviherbaspirillum sp. CPCC 100848]
MSDQSTIEALQREALPLNELEQLGRVVDQIGDASIVLLGEATHGSREFYRLRAEITKRLIADKGFDAIAVEADWPDALRVSRYARASASSLAAVVDPAAQLAAEPQQALQGFERFPQWMWRNTEIVELVAWLRQHNEQRSARGQADGIGFYGLDLYSLRNSMEAVVRYLSTVDPEAARQARARYACFDHLAEDPQRYGYAATFGMRKDCEEEVIRQLVAMTTEAQRYASADGGDAADELFYAQQNARVAQNAEAYYRSMFLGSNASWNLRDEHMADTLDALRAHIAQRKGGRAKVVIWAHNSHIGDARATEMGDHGQLNLGQLVRERHGIADTFLLGFTTHDGTVTAASEWDGPAEKKTVRPSLANSYERLLHDTGLKQFFLRMRDRRYLSELLRERRLERAIGVIYLPESERMSHYFYASLAQQFDAVIHVDTTQALRPLESVVHPHHDEAPETYPTGI